MWKAVQLHIGDADLSGVQGSARREIPDSEEVHPATVERLEFTEDSPIKIPCENCGASIRSGKYCEKCKREMTNNLSSVMEKPKAVLAEPKKPQSTGNKMRFLDRQ